MSAADAVVVRARGLREEYGRGDGLVRALDSVDLDVRRGEAVAVMGPSGCGKSTLLHLIGGLDRPSAGELTVAGQPVGALSQRALARLRCQEVGFVFQAFHLMDELTAQENVDLPALLAGCAAVRRAAPARRDRPGPGQRSAAAAGRRADRQPGQRRRVRRAGTAGRPARRGPDPGDRHPRRADRHRGGPADLDARRGVRRRGPADGRLAAAWPPSRAGSSWHDGDSEGERHEPAAPGRVTARALVLARLAGRDIRQHAAQAVLLVIAITAATATLTMALALNGGTAHPYAATRAATRGPDVVAYLPAAAQAGPLTGAAGVTAHSGPYPVASAALRFRGRSAAVFAEGRAAGPTAVDQPRLTGSQWVRPGGIVVERTFGEALGVAPRAAGGGIPAPRPRAAGAMPSGIPPAAEDAMPPG